MVVRQSLEMTMKITLKKFAHYPRMSEETVAYVAELWIDGVNYGQTSNEGQGAPDRMHHEALNLLQAYAETLPPEEVDLGDGKTFMSNPNWETVIYKAVENAMMAKQAKKPWLKITSKIEPSNEPVYWEVSKWSSLAKQLWNNPPADFVKRKKAEVLMGALNHSNFSFEVVNGSQVPVEYLG